MTTHINLLPWREERRKKRERDFYGMLGAALIAGVAIWLVGHTHLSGRIDYQERRNGFLEQEITELNKRIVKIRELESTKEMLIARMNVIQRLQQGRPQIVHLFQQFVATLPEGLYLTSLTEEGQSLTITGVAESNSRVSSYMENLHASEWMEDPDLSVIEVQERSGLRVSNFTLTVKQTGQSTADGKEGDA